MKLIGSFFQDLGLPRVFKVHSRFCLYNRQYIGIEMPPPTGLEGSNFTCAQHACPKRKKCMQSTRYNCIRMKDFNHLIKTKRVVRLSKIKGHLLFK